MENATPTLTVFEKPSRADTVIAGVAAAAVTLILPIAVDVGTTLIKAASEKRKAKKLAAKEETTTED